jgi:hypothetical protein
MGAAAAGLARPARAGTLAIATEMRDDFEVSAKLPDAVTISCLEAVG